MTIFFVGTPVRDFTNETLDRLRPIAEAGGHLEIPFEGEYDDLMELGLVTTAPAGGGWGIRELVSLTNKGRRLMGLDAITPSVRQPWWRKLLAEGAKRMAW